MYHRSLTLPNPAAGIRKKSHSVPAKALTQAKMPVVCLLISATAKEMSTATGNVGKSGAIFLFINDTVSSPILPSFGACNLRWAEHAIRYPDTKKKNSTQSAPRLKKSKVPEGKAYSEWRNSIIKQNKNLKKSIVPLRDDLRYITKSFNFSLSAP